MPTPKLKIKIIKHANYFGEGYGVQFSIGVQSFKMDYCADTKEEAKWYAEQLKKALNNLSGNKKEK